MSMTYADLKTNIADVTENTFSDFQLNLFITQAEQAIYIAIDLPASTFTETSASLSINNPLKSTPSGYLSTVSLATRDANNVITYLIEKDNSFLLEAYPDQDTTGDPVYYAQYGESGIGGTTQSMFIAVAPTPSDALALIHTYKAYPASITSGEETGTTWLSTNFDNVLLNGALVEAARFMKAEPDIVAMYNQQFVTSLKLLGSLGDRTFKDAYRTSTGAAPVGVA
jgi:hypothetical protein